MIDQEIIKQYPSLVARPYLLIKDDLQRKDMQRFWFENTISFLAVLSAAQLVHFYKELKSKEVKSEKDLETLKLLQEHKSLTMVGLEHMALGKWVMMLRETTRFLQELNAATTIPELVEFYHGNNGKNNAKIIDKLVSIRNDDAHGNPIPEDKLNAELDKRQKLIDSLLEELDFLKNYQLILPEKLEIEGSKQFYICKHFIGASIVNTKESFDFPPQLSDVMLINSTKKDARLSLNPLLLYLGIQDEENNFLGIFSKYASKDGVEAKYLNLDGSATIDLVNFGQDQDLDLIVQRQSYNEIYSDPESFQVNLDIAMKLEESIIDIKKESIFSLLIENKKSTNIEDMRVVLNIPKNIDILEFPENDSYKISKTDSQLILEFDNFEDNDRIKIEPIKFVVSEQGSYTFDGGQVLYSYYRTLADSESDQITEEDIQYEGETVEARDKNSRDKMIPVININKGFVDVNGEAIQSVKIGEDFVFRVHVSNIGFSSAKDVMIDLVFPDNINLKQGKETIKLGQLNPFEERTFKYVLTSHAPDIYSISMQNVLYSDSQKVRYSTRCADDHFIIVRSDLVKEFVYDVRDHIDDLYIDDEEKANISSMIEELDTSIDVNAYDIYKEAETEAVIKTIRDLVEKVATKKDLNVIEKVYEEGKRDSKITGTNPRKFLVYSSKEMPFFAINLTKGYEPEFFALKTNIDKRFDRVSTKQSVVSSGSYTLDHCIDFSDIKYDLKYGKNFFNQWLNIVLSRFDKEYITWYLLTKKFENIYGGPMAYISGSHSRYHGDKPSNESGVTSHHSLIDRDYSQIFYTVFEANPTPNYKQVIGNYLKQSREFVFLAGTSAKTRKRIYDDQQLAYYLQLSDTSRVSKFIALKQNIKDDNALRVTMEKTKELWEHLCLSHSLDLFDSDEFKDQKYIEEMKEFSFSLFEHGFALRQNTKNNDMLDIYPLKYFKPHTATEQDCIGFIKKNYSSWQIFLDFFEDKVDDSLIQNLSLVSTTNAADKVRWIKSDIQTIEQLDIITKAVLGQAEYYKPNKLAIWPKELQKDMLLNHGQTDTGFFIVLKNILAGKNKYTAIMEEFKSLNIYKDLDRTLRVSEIFEKDAGYEAPLQILGADEEKVIAINPMLESTVQSLYEYDSTFSYLEEGAALYRIYSQQIAKSYEPMANILAHSAGFLGKSFKVQNKKYFQSYKYFITPKKGKVILFEMIFRDVSTGADETIKEICKELIAKYNDKFLLQPSGNKKQHLKATYEYSFENFDNELSIIQDLCHELFVTVENGVNVLNNH